MHAYASSEMKIQTPEDLFKIQNRTSKFSYFCMVSSLLSSSSFRILLHTTHILIQPWAITITEYTRYFAYHEFKFNAHSSLSLYEIVQLWTNLHWNWIVVVVHILLLHNFFLFNQLLLYAQKCTAHQQHTISCHKTIVLYMKTYRSKVMYLLKFLFTIIM